MSQPSVLHRLNALRAQGGWRAVGRRLGQRLFYRHWASRVYAAPEATPAAAWPAGFRFAWFDRLRGMDASARRQLQQTGAHRLLADLGPDDSLYVVWQGERAASWGAAPRANRQVAVLGLPPGSRLVGLCETHPDFRGQGLYPLALRDAVRCLREAGERALYIEVLEDNLASIRGIERAGFRSLGRVDAHVLFGTLVLRNGRLGWI